MPSIFLKYQSLTLLEELKSSSKWIIEQGCDTSLLYPVASKEIFEEVSLSRDWMLRGFLAYLKLWSYALTCYSYASVANELNNPMITCELS